jgi:hypothetical protein
LVLHQVAGNFSTEWFVYSALQRARLHPDLSQNGFGGLDMNWFATVRAARNRDLFFAETESICSA